MSRPLRDVRVLVTGGTGFVGSHLVPMLLQDGAEVTVVAPDAGWREPLRSLVTAREVRLLPERAWWTPQAAGRIADAVHQVDHLVHLGYEPPRGTAVEQARDESAVNVAGTLGLVAAVRDRVDHVCFASSVKVYGRAGPLPSRESAFAVPVDPYGAAKLAAEQQLRVLAEGGGPACTAVRLTTLYGPAEVVPRAIPSFIRAALAGQRPTVRGPGSEVRDYLHVRDAARLLVASLVHPPEQHRLVNAGTGDGHTTRELAQRVLRLVGDRGDRGETAVPDEPRHVAGEPGADVVCDISRAETELGFRASVVLEEGLAEEIDWFAERPRLWQDQQAADRKEAS